MTKAININHSEASISVNDGTYIQLSKNGSVKIGQGLNLPEDGDADISKYAGVLRYNSQLDCYQFCNGIKWCNFVSESDISESLSVTWSLTF